MKEFVEKANKWFKVIRSAEDKNVCYFEFKDGLRIILRNGRYDGWYVTGKKEE